MIFFKKDLIGLDDNGRPCEVCGQHMHLHEWADVGSGGKVTWCNFANDVQEANEEVPEVDESVSTDVDQTTIGMVAD